MNGSVELDAPSGRAITCRGESRAQGQPSDGAARLAAVALADQRIDVDVRVTSRSARLLRTRRSRFRTRADLRAGRSATGRDRAPTSGSVTRAQHGERRVAAPQLRVDATADDLKFANGRTIDSVIASIAGGSAGDRAACHHGEDHWTSCPRSRRLAGQRNLIARGVTSEHTLE